MIEKAPQDVIFHQLYIFPQMDVFNDERKMIGLEFIKSMLILYLLNNTTELNEHLFRF
jgi:hypothetical protein